MTTVSPPAEPIVVPEVVPSVTAAHRLQYWALRGVVAVLQRLPWRVASDFGALLGQLGWRPFAIRRALVTRQVAAAFPGLEPDEVHRIARGAYAHLGRVSIETALLPRLGPGAVLDRFEGEQGWDSVSAALEAGKGIVFVSGHIGNWELAGAYIAARGVPLDVIARRMANPLFDHYLTDTRSRLGMVVVHDADAVRRSPRSLRSGRGVAFMADQGVLGLASTFVPFFGRPAKTPRGAAVFALRLGAPVIFAAAIRQPSGRYMMVFEQVPVIDSGDRDGDVDRLVARWTRTIERWVRRVPDQYFWHHRRWRRQPKDTPPELREP